MRLRSRSIWRVASARNASASASFIGHPLVVMPAQVSAAAARNSPALRRG
jgi:hypothetical protein